MFLSGWNGNNYPRWKGNHPVTSVSWYAAMAYAKWTGKRLPTEAEWEKAARGGLVGKKYPWGDSPPDGKKTNIAVPEDGYEFTSPVGSFTPNNYGLFDMLGNVGEWCLDSYHKYIDTNKLNNDNDFNKAIADTTSNFYKVESGRGVRGGSWSYESYQLSGNYRSYIPSTKKDNIGFRCVRPVKLD